MTRYRECGATGWEGLALLGAAQPPAETTALLREGMAQTGASDVLTYLLAAGEREARQLRSQARRHDSERYAALPTSKLAGMKAPEAGNER
ncbi:hypothetical protein KSD_58190 [Ktedonobacter sp. SOSP1-85]|uniref:hypothetical protein n=1 Tax=Ktedonobacter sp. SOSP1-85 TaxID=2778367 RepID=UPI001914ECCB|nr:hypothetical protein [Ktedonobacter sp. SOSP1-85]GHO78048.1 hypothetical protein KSD_58190 [Ktedonobacter sp. SOSP1-85]